MKMMKRLLVLLCMVFMLSGCVSMNIGFVVKSDKELDMNMEILMSPLLTQEMEPGEFKAQFEEGLSANGDLSKDVDVKEITKEVDGATWQGIDVKMTLTEEEVSTYLTSDDKTITFKVDMDQANDLIGPEELGLDSMDTETIELYKQYGASMTIKVTMPSKPTTNVGTIEQNTVIVDLLSDDSKTLYEQGLTITCSKGGGFDGTWMIAILVVAIIAVVGVVLVTKKKKAVPLKVEEVVNETQTVNEENNEEN